MFKKTTVSNKAVLYASSALLNGSWPWPNGIRSCLILLFMQTLIAGDAFYLG